MSRKLGRRQRHLKARIKHKWLWFGIAVGTVIGTLIFSRIFIHAEDEPELERIRTTVYTGGTHTATGRKVREGYVAYRPDYFGRTCILYTEDMQFIGIFECEDTGGSRVRSGKVLDVYCDTLAECYEWVAENGEYCYVQWIDAEG